MNHEMHARTGVAVLGLLARLSPVPRDFYRSPTETLTSEMAHSFFFMLALVIMVAVGCEHHDGGSGSVSVVSPTTEVPNLPRWANVALAARCANLLLPTLDRVWIDPPGDSRQLIADAINLASKSARLSHAQPETQAKADSITTLIQDLKENESRANSDEPIWNMIHVVRLATESALAGDRAEAHAIAEDCIDRAYRVADELDDDLLRTQIEQTVDSMVQFCENSYAQDYHCFSWQTDHWQVRK